MSPLLEQIDRIDAPFRRETYGEYNKNTAIKNNYDVASATGMTRSHLVDGIRSRGIPDLLQV